MFTLLHVLSYVGGIAAFLFVTLSLASGLLWLAELIEEHSKLAKVIGIRAVYAIMGIHVLLFAIDGFPFFLILFSLTAHAIYLTNFTAQWPFISLTSIRFILSCCMVVADHFLWFFHFAEKAQEAKAKRSPRYRYGVGAKKKVGAAGGDEGPSFMDVAAFFGICVWLVPLFLFLSLSANDNVLPSLDTSIPGTPSGQTNQFDLGTPTTLHPSSANPSSSSRAYPSAPRTSLVKSLLAPVLSMLPRLRSGRSKRNDEGIIAPRTPIKGSPMASPSLTPAYLPWGANDAETPGGSTLGPGSGATPGFQSASKRLSPLKMGAPPPPRRLASEVMTPGSTGSHVIPRNIPSPRPMGSNSTDDFVSPASLSGSNTGSSWSQINPSGGNGEGMLTDEPSGYGGLKTSASNASIASQGGVSSSARNSGESFGVGNALGVQAALTMRSRGGGGDKRKED